MSRPAPRAHWLLLASSLAVVIALLALNALVLGDFNADENVPPGTANTVPDEIRDGGAVIDDRTATPVALRPKDRTVALTFDDGPDPQWTPQVLAVLARHNVKATFFVTGTHAAEHPGLIRDILDQGHEIGNHTATHTDVRGAGDARTNLELRLTDVALAGAADVQTSLFRPPYSATPDSVDDLAWQAYTAIGAEGRLVVLSDLDSRDWERPGTAEIVKNSTPRDERGAVVLMHDAGGDRSQTVAALDQLILALRADGRTVGTVSETVGMTEVNSSAGTVARIGGWLLVAAAWASEVLSGFMAVVLVVAAALAALRTLLVLVTTRMHVRRSKFRNLLGTSKPVTVIIPAYNEKAGIEATVRSALDSTHPVTVIVVDDGSTDGTADIIERLRLRRVRVIRQRNAGKAAALNAGLAAARTEFVVMVDGDTLIEPDTVGELVKHFADETVGAVSGNAKVGNRSGLLGKWQHIEYVIGFNLDRRMYDILECMPTVPGAVGAFRRSAVLGLGGVPLDTLAEDTDLTMALERGGWRVVYEQGARVWTEAPASLGQLWKQRYRWCYGTLQAVWKHWRAVFSRGAAGRLGRRGIPYLLLFQVVLPLAAPFVDVAAIFGVLAGGWWSAFAFWLAFQLMQVIPGIVAFRLDDEPLAPLLALPLQQFVYRQLMYLVVVQSVMTAVAGARLPWQKLDRIGLAPAAR
ncbi:cellulose synthase/poly-beta-1,6-N-acetylglucosamine synthase-like glycosyltransferase/peptidoglycan/xylan/chitin deacetylase (PgdA/CDA1 family) [Kibdelosporangium banguiense]|uniref:Cellulose synthase/poly-beta-1,6-N-acetylglucosamine synthase-like glycosyltransferase/peptidoglycan/xylan/chitin deacetylase (PgdA/CDA1 family) n=1 Tax=Kibdelosporangium banguiense TaxID=1365924 RepID=A0ABS4THF4_9PSEU|nr:bifunctional polysaccharide deacetylase/glycosyltransferase family 2 protein [Kibdelosporangium banguiense]MBP2323288.1 cellulose synthase/poly-beta-1,6-N-acetylglucosamine synthase-like glycosyltransferase/peptidoglycan/xylan/chitin deacetylase (PgdA/CDA1 family) [Kibdelosporangium banguiense]